MKCTLTLLLVLAGIVASAQKTKLQLNLKQDSIYSYTQTASATITEMIQGQKQVIVMALNGTMSHKVTAVTDTSYTMSVAYETLSMHLDIAGRTMDVNSADDKQDVMSKIMNSMLHKPITIIINKSGKVLDMQNVDNLFAHMFDGFPDLPADKKAQIKAQMDQSFGGNTFKNNFQEAFNVFPDVPEAVNDKWVIDTKMEKFVFADIKTTYNLKELAGNFYKIHGDAVVAPVADAGYSEYMGMLVNFTDVTGNVTSDYKLDSTTGWITDAKVTKSIKGQMNIKDNPKVPGGMSFPMTVEVMYTTTGK